MPSRTYDQFCGLARTLDVVGDRWNLLIVRELLTGPKRNVDLRAGLAGIATNLLGERLRELEAAGVVSRRRLPPPAASTVYELTERGEGLRPAVLELARWGRPLLGERGAGEEFRPSWLLLSLAASFEPGAARGAKESYELRIDEHLLSVAVEDGRIAVADGPSPDPAARVVEADADTFLAWGTGRIDAAAALAAGLRADGGRRTLRRLRALFPPSG